MHHHLTLVLLYFFLDLFHYLVDISFDLILTGVNFSIMSLHLLFSSNAFHDPVVPLFISLLFMMLTPGASTLEALLLVLRGPRMYSTLKTFQRHPPTVGGDAFPLLEALPSPVPICAAAALPVFLGAMLRACGTVEGDTNSFLWFAAAGLRQLCSRGSDIFLFFLYKVH